MSVDENTVRHIARLARIAVTEEELAPLAKEVSSILDWVEQLGEVNTGHVAPMTSVVEMEMKMREDIVTHEDLQDQVTRNAPVSEDGFFTVPKVVE
ncbi:MAG: Asp-tRNA(Asn)/Glu-tRNA(Gln) amidotransferase subunit GatC [Parvibaculum sp.]